MRATRLQGPGRFFTASFDVEMACEACANKFTLFKRKVSASSLPVRCRPGRELLCCELQASSVLWAGEGAVVAFFIYNIQLLCLSGFFSNTAGDDFSVFLFFRNNVWTACDSFAQNAS